MTTPIDIPFSANGEQTVARAWDTIKKGIEETIRATAKLTPESQKADAAQKALGASAEKWLKAISTPMQDYLGDVEELKTLLAAGKLTQDQYTAAAEKCATKLREQTAEVDHLAAKADKLRAALITPMQKYQQELAEATELLKAQKLTEEEYAAAVAKAKSALDAQDVALQRTLADAARINQAAVTPEQRYAEAIRRADDQLKKKLISQKAYDIELANQNELLRTAQEEQAGFTAGGTSGLGQMLSQLTGVGSVVGGLAAAAGVLRSEYENLIESQKTAADKQLDTASAQRSAIFALGDDKDLSIEDMNKSAEETALKRGISKKRVYEVYANALSARGSLSAAEAIKSSDTALAVAPFEGAMELGGSLLDMKNRFGGTDRELMGLNLATQQASRVKDAASFAKNVVPTITQLGAYGDTAQTAAAIPAALSTAMNDLEGRQSATASEQLAKQLEQMFPKQGKNTSERLAYVQNNPAAYKKFWAKASFESGAYKAMRELTAGGDNVTKRNYATALATIPDMQGGGEYYDKMIGRVDEQSLQKTSAIDRQHKGLAEVGSLHNEAGARASIAREGLDKSLQSTGAWWLTRFMTARQQDFNEFTGLEKPEDFAIRTLENRSNDLKKTQVGESWGKRVEIAPDARALSDAASIDKVVDVLKSIDKKVGNPPPVKNVKQNNQPTKAPASTALAAPGGR